MIQVSDSEPIVETPELMSETIQTFRSVNESGLLVGERFHHRPWLPEITLAFMKALVVKLPAGELRRRLYP